MLIVYLNNEQQAPRHPASLFAACRSDEVIAFACVARNAGYQQSLRVHGADTCPEGREQQSQVRREGLEKRRQPFSMVISQEDGATEPRYATVRFPLLLQKQMVMVNYFWGEGGKKPAGETVGRKVIGI